MVLQATHIAQLNVMRKARNWSLEMISHGKYHSFLDLTFSKLTSNNFDDFYLALQGANMSKVGISGTPLD